MTDVAGQDIKQQYDDGIRAVQGVLFSLDSTPDQLKVADKALTSLTALLLEQTLKSIEGRTALLKGLILNLNQVIASIRVTPPLLALAQRLTGIVGKSTTLLTNINKDFLGRGESTTPSG
jgi:hypothetical protein